MQTSLLSLAICCSALSLIPTSAIRAQQQVVDPDFKVVVDRPAYVVRRSGRAL